MNQICKEVSVVDMKAGAYYFDGWSDVNGMHLSERLKTEFSTRMPPWGWMSNTVEIMEKQIELASGNGLDFFAFDWYYPEGKLKKTILNNALNLYLNAPNKKDLEFCLLVANHEGYRIGYDDWDEVKSQWISLFHEESYLKVDGKPLVIIFSPDDLTKCMGGSSQVKQAFEQLRADAIKEGFAGVTIAGCEQDIPNYRLKIAETCNIIKNEGYDFVTAYNYPVNYFAEGRGRMIHSFAEMADYHKNFAWDFFASEINSMPYIPCVTCGFDKRPWEKSDNPHTWGWYYPDRTPEQVTALIADAGEWMEKNPQKTSKEKLVLFYAWNEIGEGGYIVPTLEDGGRYLKVIGEYLKEH